MGDGKNIYLKNQPLRVDRILGFDGRNRYTKYDCNGKTDGAKGMSNMKI